MSGILIITVGSSPLPVVVSILHLKPSIMHLGHTPDVVQVVDRICEHLKRKLPGCCPKLIEVREHRSAAGIRNRLEAEEKLRGRWAECGLNYTGGTKLMAVHTHAFWSKNGGQPRNAGYLSGDGRLYFDDPGIDPVREMDLPHLSLDELCSLHFGKIPHKNGDGHDDPIRRELAARIRDFVCQHGRQKYQDLLKPIHHGATVDLEPLFQGMDVKGLNVNAVDLVSFSEWFVGKDYERMELKEKRKAQDDSRPWLSGGWLGRPEPKPAALRMPDRPQPNSPSDIITETPVLQELQTLLQDTARTQRQRLEAIDEALCAQLEALADERRRCAWDMIRWSIGVNKKTRDRLQALKRRLRGDRT